MKVVVCDDDLSYATEIKNTVSRVFESRHVSGSFDLFSDSNEVWNKQTLYDIAFLDIQMLPHSGIAVAKKLKAENQNIIIFFITSFDQYLDEAMDLNAFRYIKKPLDTKRLQEGIEKALLHIDNTIITFHLKSGKETQAIPSNEIVYVEIVGHYTKVVTIDNKEFVSDRLIGFWKKKLISSSFFSVHKSYIINMKYISEYKRDTVTLCKKYQIPIAYRKQAEFRSFFFNYFGG